MKRRGFLLLIFIGLAGGLMVGRPAVAGGLESRVNEAFRSVYGKSPNQAENLYWLGRVVSKEKTTYESLRGAMYYQKSNGATMGAVNKSVSAGSKTVSAMSTNKTQLIKDVLPIFIKIYQRNPSNAEKAWWRKRISCGEVKAEKDLVGSMKFHQSKKVGKGNDNICGQQAAQASAGGVGAKEVVGIEQHAMGPQVRIGITKMDGVVIVTSDGNYQVREGGSKVIATLGKDDQVKVSWTGDQYRVEGTDISFNTNDVVRLVPLNDAKMQVVNYHDKSTTIAGKDYNRFRGVIEVRKNSKGAGLFVINELRTEYYLRGLAETSGNGPEEYLKALATAARTYVLYHKVVTGGRSVYGDYDIGSTSDDQIYRGYEYELITPRMAQVFAKSRGIIVTGSEGDAPVTTVYFSDSDGRTRSAKEAWKTERFPHLVSVDDPHHAASACKGHCVGMSAQGAYGFAAKDDWSFQKILGYYYKDVKLVRAY